MQCSNPHKMKTTTPKNREMYYPSLLKAIMSKIMSSKPADGGQFIVSTHESNLLDYDIYRQDEIWFVEKNNGSTVMYPLTDFSRLRVRDQKEKRNTSSSSKEFRVE